VRTVLTSVCIACLVLFGGNPVLAEDEDGLRHGAIPVQEKTTIVSAATTLTYQHADDPQSNNTFFDSLDIVATIPTVHGQWLVYVEGNTSPPRQGVSSLYPEANQDVGTALDRDGHGRMQVSSLHYVWYLGRDALVLGLLNPAGPVDNSEIANNETSQFLATTLVNNPTIAFPDYALGMVYFLEPHHSPLEATFLLSSSHGLHDNPDKSYSELVDVGASGKGIFAVTELIWHQSRTIWRGGVWLQTAANAYLDGSGNTANNYGIYLNSDHHFGRYGLNVRLGAANPRVSAAAQFVGVALERGFGRHQAGIGYTYTVASDEDSAGLGNRSQIEAYYRFQQTDHLSITPSLQRIINSQFDQTGTRIKPNVAVLSLRINYIF